MNFEKIELWDKQYCAAHVGIIVNNMISTFNKNNKSNISICDIGANVGKIYDLLSSNIKIDNAFLFEGSPMLTKYMIKKFEQYENIHIRNYAITEQPGTVNFDESSMEYILNKQDNSDLFNFGLSHISDYGKIQVQSKSFVELIDEFPLIKNVDLIKIDTENRDFSILKSLIINIDKFVNLPLVVFENNYVVNLFTKKDAEEILEMFFLKGYKRISLDQCPSEGFLIPEKYI